MDSDWKADFLDRVERVDTWREAGDWAINEIDSLRAKLDIAVNRLQAIRDCQAEYKCRMCKTMAENALAQIQVGVPEK